MIDEAKKKRILDLVASTRDVDRAQGVELLRAADDRALWERAMGLVRVTHGAYGDQVQARDLPLLASAPDDLPVVQALRGSTRRMFFSRQLPVGIECLTALTDLDVVVESAGTKPRDEPSLSAIAQLRALQNLTVHGAVLGDGALFRGLSLRSVTLYNSTWSSLPELDVQIWKAHVSSPSTSSLGAGLPRARHVALSGVAELTSLDALARSTSLEVLELDSAAMRAELTPIASALAGGAPLRRLTMASTPELTSLSALSGASGLEELVLGSAPVLSDIEALAELRALTHLAIRDAAHLPDLAPIARLPALASLDLRRSAVRDLRPLLSCPALRVIALSGTAITPSEVPALLAPYCTWAEEPLLEPLALRRRHPDDTRLETGAR